MNPRAGDIAAGDEVLFRSEELLARRVGGFGSAVCYVTFDSYTDNRTLDRKGFGEDFFRIRGIDAVHVLSRENRWYQHRELAEALAAVAAATAGRSYAKVIAYGSSMGGFAALHYGAACGATIGIALSPQYSVDPAIASFDRRWANDIDRTHFRNAAGAPLPKQYLVYDPQDGHDRRHFDLFSARSPTIGIPVPHGGHPVGSYLLETGLLTAMLEAVENGTFDPAGYARELRRRRRLSGQYFFMLAQRMPPHRPCQKVALAALAAETYADNVIYQSHLAVALDQAGRFDEAYDAHLKAVATAPGNLHVLHHLLLHHELRGELDQALVAADRLIAEHPDVTWIRKVRVRIRRRQRHATRLGDLGRRLYLDWLLDRTLT